MWKIKFDKISTVGPFQPAPFSIWWHLNSTLRCQRTAGFFFFLSLLSIFFYFFSFLSTFFAKLYVNDMHILFGVVYNHDKGYTRSPIPCKIVNAFGGEWQQTSYRIEKTNEVKVDWTTAANAWHIKINLVITALSCPFIMTMPTNQLCIIFLSFWMPPSSSPPPPAPAHVYVYLYVSMYIHCTDKVCICVEAWNQCSTL